MKTSLKKDDGQICVAYNVMWAALREGYNVKVLVDADAVNIYKVGWGLRAIVRPAGKTSMNPTKVTSERICR